MHGQAGPPQDGQSSGDAHPVLATSKISELAHRVMACGLKANALAADDLKPWHMKADSPPGFSPAVARRRYGH
jgi:hypothetical protein